MGEYVHIVRTKDGERRAVGCDLELVPVAQTNVELTRSTASSEAQDEHNRFMRTAIEEARNSVPEDGRVHPKMGVVVVKDGQVLRRLIEVKFLSVTRNTSLLRKNSRMFRCEARLSTQLSNPARREATLKFLVQYV